MDHPLVAECIRTGYPHGEPEYPHCPVCDSECEDIYRDENGVVFGCDCCIRKESAWGCEECF